MATNTGNGVLGEANNLDKMAIEPNMARFIDKLAKDAAPPYFDKGTTAKEVIDKLWSRHALYGTVSVVARMDRGQRIIGDDAIVNESGIISTEIAQKWANVDARAMNKLLELNSGQLPLRVIEIMKGTMRNPDYQAAMQQAYPELMQQVMGKDRDHMGAERFAQLAKARLPFNPVDGGEIVGKNMDRLVAGMKLFGWADPRFVTQEQAQANAWAVDDRASSVVVKVRGAGVLPFDDQHLFNATDVLGMPPLASMLAMSDEEIAVMQGREAEDELTVGPALARQVESEPGRDANGVGRNTIAADMANVESMVAVDIDKVQPIGASLRDSRERLAKDAEMASAAVAPKAAEVGSEGKFGVMADYWQNGLHNSKGVALAKEINKTIKSSGLEADKEAIARLLAVHADARRMGINVVTQARLLSDFDLRANVAEPRNLLNGALVRDKEGAYRPAAGGLPVLVDKGESLSLKGKSAQGYQAAMELALAKGWTAIELKGKPAMLANAWLEAKMIGLDVVNYSPTDKDKAAFAQRVAEESKVKASVEQTKPVEMAPENVEVRPAVGPNISAPVVAPESVLAKAMALIAAAKSSAVDVLTEQENAVHAQWVAEESKAKSSVKQAKPVEVASGNVEVRPAVAPEILAGVEKPGAVPAKAAAVAEVAAKVPAKGKAKPPAVVVEAVREIVATSEYLGVDGLTKTASVTATVTAPEARPAAKAPKAQAAALPQEERDAETMKAGVIPMGQPPVVRSVARAGNQVRSDVTAGAVGVTVGGATAGVGVVGNALKTGLVDTISQTQLAGKLVEHGAAPFQHKLNGKMNYFAVIENEQGERETKWGVDLARSLAASGAKVGDLVSLARGELVPVTVNEKQPDGSVVPIEAQRQTWETVLLSRAVEVAAQAEQASLTEKKDVVVAGLHVGKIMEIVDGRAKQQTGRDPVKDVKWHDLSKLNGPVLEVGKLAEIQYSRGKGKVKGPEMERAGIGR